MAKAAQKPYEEPKRPVMSFGPYPTDRNTSVEVAIWQNEIEVEDERTVKTFNITPSRSYRDKEGEWHKNTNLRPHDIPVLIHALNSAYSWVLENRHAEPEGE